MKVVNKPIEFDAIYFDGTNSDEVLKYFNIAFSVSLFRIFDTKKPVYIVNDQGFKSYSSEDFKRRFKEIK